MENKPWFSLNPDDFISMWWRKDDILDITKNNSNKDPSDILAYIIIQDGNMGGIYWHISTWYIDDPNRYHSMIIGNYWPFNKELTNMAPGDIIYLSEHPDIKFNVYYSNFGLPNQRNFCKILQRILS